MEKNPIVYSSWLRKRIKFIFLTMKLLSVLIFAGSMALSASTYSQKTKIDLRFENSSLTEILNSIEKSSEFIFIYNENVINSDSKRSISVKGETIEKVLNLLFQGIDVTYRIDDRQVFLYKREDLKKPESINERIIGDQAPKKELSGIVNDTKGLPLPGVTVIVKGTTTGTITDTNGQFRLSVPVDTKILVFSFVGMKAQEVAITGKTTVNIVMEEQTVGVEEVVVVGYGTVRKSDITGSVGVVKMQDVEKAPVKSFEDALQGRVAGLQLTSSEGGPGSDNSMILRGGTSITGDNSPLYIIDGFPIENDNGNNINGSSGNNPANPANSINPSDIESITVLKDASSTAIYGSRGANGVIIITTKKGKSGTPVITFDGYYGLQKNHKKMEVLDPYEYVKLQIELVGTAASQLYTPGDRTLDYYLTQQAIDWQEQVFQVAPMQNYNVSLRGGNDNTKYSASASTTSQEGTIKYSGFKRYQGRMIFDQAVNSKLNLNLNLNYATAKNSGGSPSSYGGGATNATSSLLYGILGYRGAISPNSSLEAQLQEDTDPDGRLASSFNPFRSVEEQVYYTLVNSLSLNSYLDYKIIDNLTLRVRGAINNVKTQNNVFYNSHTPRGAPGTILGVNGTIVNIDNTSYLNENTLTYKKVFNNTHAINLLGVFSVQKSLYKVNGAVGSQINDESLGLSGIDNGIPYQIISGSSNNFLNSYAASANYNYKSKYFLTAVFRADGSSKFAPGNQWGYFPAGAIAWTPTKEKFMENIKFISDAKLRTSYGVSGNNRVGDFAYRSTIASNTNNSYAFGNTYEVGSVPGGLGNEDLKWESTATTDVGLDVSFFDSRLELTADYYRKITSDLLLNAQLPGHLGYLSGIKNIGKTSNTGWEFSLSNVNIDNKIFKWNTSFNIAFNENKLLALTENQYSLQTAVAYDTNSAGIFPYIAIVGQPVSQFFGYKWLGNYQYSDFDVAPNGAYVLKPNLSTNGTARANIKPGDIKYEDLNGDLVVNAADRTIIGKPTPDFFGGFSNNFSYKGFDLNVFFTFSLGNDIQNVNRMVFEGATTNFQNQFKTVKDRWTPENQTNTINRIGGAGIIAYSSRTIEDGSFLRLKTVALNYTLPAKWLSAAKVRSARVYLSAQNLAIWTKYRGYDPEVSTRNSALTPGYDYAAYPRPRTVTFGFNLSF